MNAKLKTGHVVTYSLAALGYVSYNKRYWLYGEKYQKIKDEIDRNRLSGAETETES